MKSIHQWFDEYAVSHQHPTNKLIHGVCVPLIYFSIICLLSIPRFSIPLTTEETIHLSPATLAILFVLFFYIRLSIPIAFGVGIFSVICLFAANRLSRLDAPLWQSAAVIFVLAWIGQLIGHRVEGKKPSFVKDLQFLLIGPAWLLSFLYKKTGMGY